MNQAQQISEAMKTRPPALEPWKNRKHVRIRQQTNDLVASGKMKPAAKMACCDKRIRQIWNRTKIWKTIERSRTQACPGLFDSRIV